MKPPATKTRIIYLIGHLGLGGSEHQLFLLLSHLDAERYERHVVVFNPSSNYVFDAELEAMGVRVWNMPPAVRGIPKRMAYLWKLFRQVRPHIVHSWTVHDNPYAGVVGLLAGVPVRMGSLRNSLTLDGTANLPRVFKWLAFHSVKRLVVNAQATVSELQAIHYPMQRVVYLPNCLDTERFSPDGAVDDLSAHGVEAGQTVVGIVANLRRVKNYEMFIAGMARIIERRPEVRAVIFGQPIPAEPDYPELMRGLIAQHAMQGKIIMAGFSDSVPTQMRRMDVVCMTSNNEGMPNAVLEAMAVGKPVVSTRVGGVTDLIVDRVSGMLIDPGDVEGFVEAVECVLDNPEMAKSMGAAALARIQEGYRCDLIAAEFDKLYQQFSQSAGQHFSKRQF
jgi:glycosyltransferase involved in cell wall biosynthesis